MTVFDDLYDRFHEMHADITQAMEGLSVEALDWIPGDSMNSICVLIIHAIGAERYWIGDVVLEDASARIREKEFEAQGLSQADLQERITRTDEYTKNALAQLSLPELEKIHKSPRNDREFTSIWAISHALEHLALHTGQIQLTAQLWKQSKG